MAGSELRRLRRVLGRSQFELARDAGIDRTRISLAENNHVELSVDEGKRLARAFLSVAKQKMTEVEAIANLFAAA
jgi:transcriptional regulator with XRE-family HTH domain